MKIIAVFKTHFDIGFTKLSEEVAAEYGGKMLSEAVEVCEKTQAYGKGKRYVWTMAGWPLRESLKRAEPQLKARAEALIRGGQLVCHGLPFTTHTEFLTRDELDYGCKISKDLCKAYGVPAPISAKMTDVPGHCMGLIKVLCDNGIRFLHLGCNPASTPPDVPPLFFWEDDEGNRVLTMYNATYGSGLKAPADWKLNTYLAMQQTNDNMGPQTKEIIDTIFAKVDAGDELTVGTMDDFYNEISKEDLSILPVVKGELGDTWIHGIATYPVEVKKIRRARSVVEQCRKLAKKNQIDISEPLAQYYESVLLFGEHTWGLDVKTHLGWDRAYEKADFVRQRSTSPKYAYMEKSWDEQRLRAQKAEDAAALIAKKVAFTESPQQLFEESRYEIGVKKGKPCITLPSGKKVTVSFEYKTISTDKMHCFMKKYLRRLYEWAIIDFGRQSYPEKPEKIFSAKLQDFQSEPCKLSFEYRFEEQAYRDYGASETYRITLEKVQDGVRVKVSLKDKEACPMLEGGDVRFDFAATRDVTLDKCGISINPYTDVVKDANSLLYCVGKGVRADGIQIDSLDAPLVSLNKSAVFEDNTARLSAPIKSLYYNVFNNMWGTNFPQWTQGDMEFEFFVSEKGNQ